MTKSGRVDGVRAAAAIVGLLLLPGGGMPAAQEAVRFPTPFEGRWKLAAPVAGAEFAAELSVGEIALRSTLTVERRFADGVALARLALNNTPSSGEQRATVSGARLALRASVATRTRPAPAGSYEERWSVESTSILVVETVTQAFAAAPVTSRAVYERVPLPRTIAPEVNLVDNGDAAQGMAGWYRHGPAEHGACAGNPCFIVRGDGTVSQTIRLPSDAGGKHVLIIGAGSTERVNADAVITGLPTLHALVGASDGIRIVGHLQGMSGRPSFPNQWVTMSGVFKLHDDAAVLSLTLRQASSRGTPHYGSAAMFDDIAVHLFDAAAEARAFAVNWKGRTR